MSKTSQPILPGRQALRRRLPATSLGILLASLAAGLLGPGPVRADDPGDQYQQMYMLIQQADALDAGNQAAPALAKYRQAMALAQSIRRDNPLFNTEAVSYRYSYLAGRITALTTKVAAAAAPKRAPEPAITEPKPAAAPATADSAHRAKLISAGAEPRKVLRLHPKAGDKETVTLTIKTSIAVQGGPASGQPIKTPPVKITRNLTVKQVTPAGDIVFEAPVVNADTGGQGNANAQIADALKSAFSGPHTISDRGFPKEADLPAAAAANPVADQLGDIDSLDTVALPDEPVGPGARWEVTKRTKQQGINLQQTTTYQLVAADGDHLTIKETCQQHAASQKFQHPALPGMVLDLTKLAGTGTEDVTLDLGRVLPLEGTGSISLDVTMAMDVGGQKQSMTVKDTVDLQFEGK
jgi:hypothetical protein